MRIKIDIPKDSKYVYFLKFSTFDDLPIGFRKITGWRIRTFRKIKRMLIWMEIPYTVVGEYELEVEDGILTQTNIDWLTERINTDFKRFASNKGITRRKLKDFKNDTHRDQGGATTE